MDDAGASMPSDRRHAGRDVSCCASTPRRSSGARTGSPPKRSAIAERIIETALEDVPSLDEDRILRRFVNLVRATHRAQTFSRPTPTARRRTSPSRSKLSSVDRNCPSRGPSSKSSSTRRASRACTCAFGEIARGGIALVGPAGGFPHRGAGSGQGAAGQERRHRAGRRQGRLRAQSSPPAADRDAVYAEGTACYKIFIGGLLDITDNLDGDKRCIPPQTGAPRRRRSLSGGRRRQGHGEFLRHRQRDLRRRTASGSAMPSPRAARPATTTRRWASPRAAPGKRSSAISARWTATSRPSPSPSSASATCRATCSATACCCREQIRLIAAFDHRDIFIDPDPDPATSFAERKRLFELPRSSWQDYDTTLISKGGGVYSRQLKSMPLSAARSQDAARLQRQQRRRPK